MKTSVSLRAPRMVAILALAFASLSASNLSAQNATVSTIPVGAVISKANAGTGVARTLSTVSFPLINQSVVSGQVIGQITGLTANTITNSNAGWTPGALSTVATPNLIQITSGTERGRIFLISTAGASQNTATTLTIDSEEAALVNLTTSGIVVGDSYRILDADTLNDTFKTPALTGVLANTDPTLADNVQILFNGTYRTYFHNGTNWTRPTGGNSNNVVIRPDSIVLYSRLANSDINLSVTGEVPSIQRKAIIRNSGTTTLSAGWPTNLTLGTSSINSTPGWVSNPDPNIADTVQVLFGTPPAVTYRTYFHNGTNWTRPTGGNSTAVSLATATGLIINKKGSAPGSSVLTQALPYTLTP